MTHLSRRGFLVATTWGAAALTLAGCAPTVPSSTVTTHPPERYARTFTTGVSCRGAADGVFGRWRSLPVEVSCTWGKDGALNLLAPGAEFGDWEGDLDYAPQYYFDSTFSWRSLADGEYDKVLRADLTALRDAWGGRAGTLYYRFQHEFNGHWYPWGISNDTIEDHKEGWRHFAGIFREVFGYDSRFWLSWSPAVGVASRFLADVSTAFPGADVVDVIGVDYYDFFPTSTAAEWEAALDSTDDAGGPVGLGAWREFAESVGVPLALPEWGQQFGDNPLFIAKVHEFLDKWRFTGEGSSAGRVIYDCYFNQVISDGTPETNGDFLLSDNGVDNPLRPEAAATYRELWSSWSAVR